MANPTRPDVVIGCDFDSQGLKVALVAIGAFANLSETAERVVRLVDVIEPNPAVRAGYAECYQFYRETYFALLPASERAAARAGMN